MKNMPEFIVHVSVELADSMVEEKLRYTTNKGKQTYTIGEAENNSKNRFPFTKKMGRLAIIVCALER